MINLRASQVTRVTRRKHTRITRAQIKHMWLNAESADDSSEDEGDENASEDEGMRLAVPVRTRLGFNARILVSVIVSCIARITHRMFVRNYCGVRLWRGFVVNEAKSTWAPTQKLQWLGFTIDLEHGQVSVPEKKLSNLRKLLEDACKQDYADVFSSGVWPLLSNLEDPELGRLAKALPATVLKCKADSATKKYLGAFQRWKT
eukprot:Em0003g743a